MTMSCPCCGTGAVEPLYGCCEACATNNICRRCVSCGTWYHDHPHNQGLVRLGPDKLPRCADGCRRAAVPARV